MRIEIKELDKNKHGFKYAVAFFGDENMTAFYRCKSIAEVGNKIDEIIKNHV